MLYYSIFVQNRSTTACTIPLVEDIQGRGTNITTSSRSLSINNDVSTGNHCSHAIYGSSPKGSMVMYSHNCDSQCVDRQSSMTRVHGNKERPYIVSHGRLCGNMACCLP